MLHGLDLFSGIGGLSLALQPWVRTIAYCENERYAQSVLLSRMSRGELEVAPIWSDVRTINGQMLPPIDIIFGGFPCQDISTAGLGAGMEQGSRSGLFFEVTRLIQEVRPAFVFLENVPAIRTRGLSRVLSELTALGYDCRWTVVSAAEVGAPHLRKRWFLLAAHTDSINEWIKSGRRGWQERQSKTESRDNGAEKLMANSYSSRCSRENTSQSKERLNNSESIGNSIERERETKAWWTVEPDVGRVVDGLPFRVDRLRCLGNAVVPEQAREAFKKLSGLVA